VRAAVLELIVAAVSRGADLGNFRKSYMSAAAETHYL
jgi:hypothetical protein